MKDIKSGQLSPFYIFYGDEHQVMKTYIEQMAKRNNLEKQYVESIYDLTSKARTSSLIKTRHLYIIMDDKDYLTNDKLWDKFRGLKDDVVIFYYTKADQRLKFWKKFKDRAVEFKKLDEDMLIKYIRKDFDLDKLLCIKLINVCENDYGRILLELDKINQYSRAMNITENEACIQFLKDGTIYRPPKDAIFDFVNAVLDRDVPRAYKMLEQSYAVGEANMVLLSVLYTGARNLLVYQSAKNSVPTGLTGWQQKNVAPFKNRYSNGELVKMMMLIREAESGIKKGLMPDEMSVESVLVKVM